MKPGGNIWSADGDRFCNTMTELKSLVINLLKPEKS